MTKEEVKTFLPIMQAYVEGKQIQRLYHNGWKDVDKLTSDLYISPELYRIKPESKYRPFKDVEECWNELQKHQPLGWIKSGKFLMNIISIGAGITVHNGISDCEYSFKSAFSSTFADGTPFGVKIEEE